MKKIIFSLLVISGLVACESKTSKSDSPIPANAFGYTIDSSDNINTVKKAINAGVNSDTAVFLTIYADTAAIYDNMNKQTIHENMNMAKVFKSKGITMRLEKMIDIWETIIFKEGNRPYTDHVNVYFDASFIKGSQTVTTRINAIFAFKDGKIIREWDTYDSAPLVELFK